MCMAYKSVRGSVKIAATSSWFTYLFCRKEINVGTLQLEISNCGRAFKMCMASVREGGGARRGVNKSWVVLGVTHAL